MTPKLQIKLLGSATIQNGGTLVNKLPSRAAEALFLYLTCNRRPFGRETLAELLWAERTTAQALTNLRTILTPLRRELDEYLVVTRETLAFNTENDFWLDVDEFELKMKEFGLPERGSPPKDEAAARELQLVLDLYQGDFLLGFSLRDGQGFEEWVILQRERLKRLAREGFRLLTHYLLDSGQYSQAILNASHWQQLDPYDEDACRAQMWALMRNGQRSAALQAYRQLKENLAQEVGVSPSSATSGLFQRFNHLDFPPSIELPTYPNEFLGRGREIESIKKLLGDSQTRLVTIAGPGGIGKTRLAAESARSLGRSKPGQFLHGIHFIPLAAIDLPQEIPGRIAETVGLVVQGPEPVQKQLLEFLRDREVLFILDNFEHLLSVQAASAVSLIVDLLRQAPGVKLLVTSRERLNLYDEVVFDVAGLEVPDDDPLASRETSAIVLFSQSAQRVQRDFSLENAGVGTVVRICRLVSGMPLAIELASAWVRHYDCRQIEKQIETDLDFLASPYQDVATGHRSLRAVFERSWSLLSPAEQAAFARLSVFRAGFRLEAAQAVLEDSGGTNAELPIASLVDKSLLQVQPDGRYDIHPILLQYASEKLPAPELEAVSARHMSHYLAFLAQLGDGEVPEKRAAISPERANIRLAWERAARKGLLQELGQTTAVLHSFFSVQSWFQEGIELFQHALDVITANKKDEADGLACELLGRKARMHIQVGQLAQARADLQQALAYLENLDDPARRSRVLDSLAIASYYAGEYPQAVSLANESLQLSEQEQNLDGMAFSLNFLGSCAKAQGNYDQSQACFERAAKTYHQMKDEIGAAMVLNNLGNLLQAQSDFERAQQYYLQSSEIFKVQSHLHGAATTLANAGKLAAKQGNHDLARSLLQESLEMKRKVQDQRGVAVALAGLGDISLLVGQLTEARQQFLDALNLAQQIEDVQLTLDLLTALADLAVQQGQADLARNLLSFVLLQDGTAEEARQRATRLNKELPHPSDKPGEWDQEMLEDVVEKAIHAS
jgi:predicted ATPase/DNA-binding SARP family transcriptional activator/Tfp pilus assembly protein PilF